MKQSTSPKPTLPSVVQVGFSGSRRLFDNVELDSSREQALCDQLQDWLEQRFHRIRQELKLESNQFLVGVSQMARGADTVFSKACRTLNLPQRVFLPESRQLFLSAAGENAEPDFTAASRSIAEDLFRSAHLIEERVVGYSPDRATRFEESNGEIMRVSDVMIFIVRANATGERGGSLQLLERATRRGLPVLEIQIRENDGQLEVVKDEWRNLASNSYQPPKNLPAVLAACPYPSALPDANPLPEKEAYCDALTSTFSTQASGMQRMFRWLAAIIISTHIAATVLATLAIVLHALHHEPATADSTTSVEHQAEWFMLSLLGVELALLVLGFVMHQVLHHSHAVYKWAISRVVCELVRSLQAIGTHHLYLEHFFRLHLPGDFRPLLRTLSVLHLRATWPLRDQAWEPQRLKYIHERFDDPVNGQVVFFQQALKRDERVLAICQFMFLSCSLLAMLATTIKMVLLWRVPSASMWLEILGGLAITLPVLAVGGLSWAAAMDSDARVETFAETLRLLERQRPLLEQADSRAEFNQLLLETETVLLGEVTNWFSRRSSKGVT